MTRINRPDTLLTELRDLKRRLRLLEAGRMRPPSTAAATPTAAPLAAGGAPAPVPLMPVRPADWPATGSAEWERLAVTRAAGAGQVTLHMAVESGTTGQVRVLVDGTPVGEPVPVGEAAGQSTVDIDRAGEVAVEVRRTGGTGLVRAAALYQPG
jgi:hypothetical protein